MALFPTTLTHPNKSIEQPGHFTKNHACMSVETQKLELISWIASLDDPKAVNKLYEQVKKLLQHADMLDDLPPEVLAELEAADAETDPGDIISQEEAFSMFRGWQKP